MRTIKFRAYYIPWKKMGDVTRLNLSTYNVWIKFEDGVHSMFRRDEVELMQFTGVLDKNGKEIYEGDLYQLKGLKMLEVEWLNGEDGFYGWNFAREDGEVIGNIYENSELLK